MTLFAKVRKCDFSIRAVRRAAAAAFCSAVCLGANAAENSAHTGDGENLDFTSLSLEELLQEEITPINVLGSHTHLGGEFMFGYRYSHQHFQGNLSGTREVSGEEVLQHYRVHHTWMTMEMHMFEMMYAPTDRFTIMGMGHYMDMAMEHLRRDGSKYISESGGFGDVELMALYTVLGNPRGEGHRLVLNAGVSLPTGAIDETHNGAALEYPMQLGSGTYDLLPGLTYLGHSESFSWGAQALGRLRTGENSRNYRLGHAYLLDSWVQYKLREWIGPSLRLQWRQWGNIRGSDHALDPMHNAAFDPNLQKGRRLDFLGGLNFYAHQGPLKGFRLSAEAGVPIYQNLAGPNLELDWIVNVGVSYVFR